MEHFKDNSGCSGPKKSEIFWNNSRKVQYVFAGVISDLLSKVLDDFCLIMHNMYQAVYTLDTLHFCACVL